MEEINTFSVDNYYEEYNSQSRSRSPSQSNSRSRSSSQSNSRSRGSSRSSSRSSRTSDYGRRISRSESDNEEYSHDTRVYLAVRNAIDDAAIEANNKSFFWLKLLGISLGSASVGAFLGTYALALGRYYGLDNIEVLRNLINF